VSRYLSQVREVADQLRPVTIPDVLPTNLFPDSEFSMVAGEFIQVRLGGWQPHFFAFGM
jgi:hypothetical protein